MKHLLRPLATALMNNAGSRSRRRLVLVTISLLSVLPVAFLLAACSGSGEGSVDPVAAARPFDHRPLGAASHSGFEKSSVYVEGEAGVRLAVDVYLPTGGDGDHERAHLLSAGTPEEEFGTSRNGPFTINNRLEIESTVSFGFHHCSCPGYRCTALYFPISKCSSHLMLSNISGPGR